MTRPIKQIEADLRDAEAEAAKAARKAYTAWVAAPKAYAAWVAARKRIKIICAELAEAREARR